MLPLIQALAAEGLTLLANAVMAKGKEVVEEKLGVSLKPDPTPDEVASYRKAEMEHEEFLIDAALQDRKLDIENTKDARNMNVHIQESANASTVSKNAAYYIDFAIVGAVLATIVALMFFPVPIANKEYFYMAIGSLLTLCGTIINFHRGTSASSQRNGDVLRNVLEKGVK